MSIDLFVTRQGSTTSPNTFKNGAVVTFSEFSNSDAARVTTVLPTPATITLPPDWGSKANNTVSDKLRAALSFDTTSLTVGSTIFSSVVHRASGLNTDNATTNRDATALAVTATVVDGDTAEVEDCIVPIATIATPTDGADFLVGDTAAFDFSCSDEDPGVGGAGDSGLAAVGGCVAVDQDSNSVADGDAIDTSVPGSYSITVTAKDAAGNTSSTTHDYTVTAPPDVTYSASFKQPIDGSGVINIAKLGRVIPVKVELLGDDTPQSEIEAGEGPVSLQTIQISCESQASDSVESYSAGSSNTGNQFRWDAMGGFWVYNLDTSKIQNAGANRCFDVSVFQGGTADANGIVAGGVSVGSFRIRLTK